MAVIQWVNLEKDAVYAEDADIDSEDRCGTLVVKASFQAKDTPLQFKIKVTDVGSDNVIYTTQEKNRNPNFKLTMGTTDIALDTEVLLEDNLRLPAAGGNVYKVEAIDANGTVVSSGEFETMRKLYYQTLYIDHAEKKANNVSLSSMEAHAQKYSIKLEKLGNDTEIIEYQNENGRQTLVNFKTITDDNMNQFAASVVKHTTLKDAHKKVGFAAIFANYVANYKKHTYREKVNIGTVNPMCQWNSSQLVVGSADVSLWHGLVDSDDKDLKWFDKLTVKYRSPKSKKKFKYTLKNSTAKSKNLVNVFTPAKSGTYGGYWAMDITLDQDLSKLLTQASADGGEVEVKIKAYVVDGWSGGFSTSYGSTQMIVNARLAFWEDNDAAMIKQVWNHELGHRLGMTAYGDSAKVFSGWGSKNKLPDGPPSLYGEKKLVERGHQGPHCDKGAFYNDALETWSGTPECVMFGQTSLNGVATPEDYCSNCKDIVRKLDLSE